MNNFAPAIRQDVDTLSKRVAAASDTLSACLAIASQLEDEVAGPKPTAVSGQEPLPPSSSTPLCFSVNKLVDRANTLRDALIRIRESL